MTFIRILTIATVLVVPNGLWGAVTISSLPYSYDFDDTSYESDHLWLSNGASQQFLASGGWDGGGAVKISPPLTAGGYGSLGSYHLPAGVSRVNVRWLVYHGSTYEQYNANIKKIIIEGASVRPMVIESGPGGSSAAPGDRWRAPGACYGTTCRYDDDLLYYADGDELYKVGRDGRTEEWVCYELEGDASTGIVKLFITTRDGEFSEYEITSHSGGPTGGNHSYFWIGMYTDNAQTADDNNYYIIDELRVDDSYIGPPDGFLSDTTPSITGIPLIQGVTIR